MAKYELGQVIPREVHGETNLLPNAAASGRRFSFLLESKCGPVVYSANTLPFQGRDNGFESRPGYQLCSTADTLRRLLYIHR
jgi:hypothetical protein